MVLALVISLLLGSIPSGYLIGRLLGGQDPRRVGSGNVGGMNVLRNIGFAPGVCTILADMTKGILAAVLARGLCGSAAWGAAWVALPACVAGHNWMPWLGFRGGKGLAVSGGALMVLHFPAAAVVFPSIGAMTLVLQDSDLASLLTFAFLPLILWVRGAGPWAIAAAGAVAVENGLRLGPELIATYRRKG